MKQKKPQLPYIILIPSFEPDLALLDYVRQLLDQASMQVIVVDDGSGDRYAAVFTQLQQLGALVIQYEPNRGKGEALKTGYRYIKKHIRTYACIVTADSDGQHAVGDVLRLARQAASQPDSLILGVRDFKLAQVPAKSRWGNRLASLTFALFCGKWLPDTQTGLRAFGPSLLDLMLFAKGSRFEYEMQVLISCVQTNIPIISLPIQTIYLQANQGSHYRPLLDTLKIGQILGKHLFKFAGTSLAGAGVDIAAAWFLLDWLSALMQGHEYAKILVATVVARIISLLANYLLNRGLVFAQVKTKRTQSLQRYLLLSVLLMLLSSTGVYLLHHWLYVSEKAGKLICDTALFFLSYQLQVKWVFKPKTAPAKRP
ncbi:MAG: bifunctional glycosyltransferase family 2/GtrA family protein [Oscillospiraceae bacterium]|nr:bifunctional glycosyltransferase family 2/GtrA family protein [Oscillospiraceae bacterium]